MHVKRSVNHTALHFTPGLSWCGWNPPAHGHANGLERTRNCCLVTHAAGIKTAMGIQLEIALLSGKTLLCPSWQRQGAASWRRPATQAKFHAGRKIHHVDRKDRIVSGFGFFDFCNRKQNSLCLKKNVGEGECMWVCSKAWENGLSSWRNKGRSTEERMRKV